MKSLRLQLITYFKENDGFTAKQQVVDDIRSDHYTNWGSPPSSEYILRELRKLREEGRLEVEYRGQSQHSFYKHLPSKEETYHQTFISNN